MERIGPERMAAWRRFLEAHARVAETLAAELERERGMSLAEYEVLLLLEKAPGRRLRMSELARRVLLSRSGLISRSGLTRLVDRMERAGLVRRASCASDRRGVEAVIAEEGREALRAAAPVHLRGVAEHFTSHLTREEARTLARALDKVADSKRGADGAAARS